MNIETSSEDVIKVEKKREWVILYQEDISAFPSTILVSDEEEADLFLDEFKTYGSITVPPGTRYSEHTVVPVETVRKALLFDLYYIKSEVSN